MQVMPRFSKSFIVNAPPPDEDEEADLGSEEVAAVDEAGMRAAAPSYVPTQVAA